MKRPNQNNQLPGRDTNWAAANRLSMLYSLDTDSIIKQLTLKNQTSQYNSGETATRYMSAYMRMTQPNRNVNRW